MKSLRSAEEIVRVAGRHANLRAISIDLFDTLVFRKAFDPLDALALQHADLRAQGLYEGDAASWTALRKQTEHVLATAAAPHEITLAEIYRELRMALGWTREQTDAALAAELRIEAELIAPYREVVAALERLQASGLAVIVQTDTYLPPAFLRDLLSRWLSFPYELRCSSETGAPKRSGLAYAALRRDHGDGVIHFGDNHAVDVVLARKAGVPGYHVAWPRAALLERSLQKRYAAALGLHRVRTSRDDGSGTALTDLAFRWSLVMADFMMAIRHHADTIAATDIWLLSRDCESIWDVARRNLDILGPRTVRYVACSRSSCHPILAVTDPPRFASWGHADSDAARAAGEAAIAYYRHQLAPGSTTVLLVDTGWKGRLQAAIASALPEVAVHGFYFALEPGAEPDAARRAGTFLPWLPRTFAQPVIEAMAGFTGASCGKFTLDRKGRPTPLYKSSLLDRSPEEYCTALRAQVAALFEVGTPVQVPPTAERLRLRREAVAQICAYPDATVIAAFRNWQIGIEADDSDVGDLLSGGSASRLDRLLGRRVGGNVWPRAAVWSVVSNPRLVRSIFYADDQAFRAKTALKQLLGR